MTECKFGHLFCPDNTYVNRRGAKQCNTCRRARQNANAARQRDRARNHSREQRILHPEIYYARTAALKARVLGYYGLNGEPCCVWEGCCVSDLDVLTLDHKADDGAKHRKTVASGSALYQWIVKSGFPAEGFQTLCMNHQWKKEMLRKAEYRSMRIEQARMLKAKATSKPDSDACN